MRVSQAIAVPLMMPMVWLLVSKVLYPKSNPKQLIHGVHIEFSPPPSKLAELGVTTWPKWESGPVTMPWTFEATETMYIVEGKIKVEVDGYEKPFELGAGNLAVFPKGMKITWEVLEPVKKHYSLKD